MKVDTITLLIDYESKFGKVFPTENFITEEDIIQSIKQCLENNSPYDEGDISDIKI